VVWLGMKKLNISGIYSIQCKVNQKLYIGSAINIGYRWGQHLRSLKRKDHPNRKLQNAWYKYGAEAFVFAVVEIVDNVNDLLAREQYWIDKEEVVTKGYNLAPKAGSLLNFKHTDETKGKMSEAHIGLPRSDEHKRNLSIANTGKKMSEEARQKMREAKLGKKRGPMSDETKAKIVAKAIGRKASEEAKEKMSKAKLGKLPSEETKQKMSASHKATLNSFK